MITSNNALITSKAGPWELLINYFKQYYGNEHATGDGQPEAAVVAYRHTAGENGMGLNRPAIITKLFKKSSIRNNLDGTEDELLWAEQYDKSDEEGDDM